jgi:hypothetical protein
MTKQTGITEIRTSRWTEPFLPAGVDRLANSAADQGHPFLFRLQDEWLNGAVCFKGPGACLFIAKSGDKLVGIAGVCGDPYQPAITSDHCGMSMSIHQCARGMSQDVW